MQPGYRAHDRLPFGQKTPPVTTGSLPDQNLLFIIFSGSIFTEKVVFLPHIFTE
jgi:hypothetical protein